MNPKRALYEVGPDHQEMLEWSEVHMVRIRQEFIRWLLKSRFRVSCASDPVAITIGKYTPLKTFTKYRRDGGLDLGDTPEEILSRRFTRRVLCHLLQGVRFVRKTV